MRLRLLRPDEDGGLSQDERGFASCQLDTRHWTMQNTDGTVDPVVGSGVVGRYPLLRENGNYRDDHQSSRCRLNLGVPPDMVDEGPEIEAEEVLLSHFDSLY